MLNALKRGAGSKSARLGHNLTHLYSFGPTALFNVL